MALLHWFPGGSISSLGLQAGVTDPHSWALPSASFSGTAPGCLHRCPHWPAADGRCAGSRVGADHILSLPGLASPSSNNGLSQGAPHRAQPPLRSCNDSMPPSTYLGLQGGAQHFRGSSTPQVPQALPPWATLSQRAQWSAGSRQRCLLPFYLAAADHLSQSTDLGHQHRQGQGTPHGAIRPHQGAPHSHIQGPGPKAPILLKSSRR